jgi:hypothetical protein
VIRVVPIPALAPFVVVSKDPLEALNVRLLDVLYELIDVVRIGNEELIGVVALLPILNSQLYMINVAFDLALLFCFSYALSFFDHHFLGQFVFLCNRNVFSVECLIELNLSLFSHLLFL